MTLILALNAGSSSLKISLYNRSIADAASPQLLLKASISSISAFPAKFGFTGLGRNTETDEPDIIDHDSAFAHFLHYLTTLAESTLDPAQISHVCHRVVHGGAYTRPVIVTHETLSHIEAVSALAPLHNTPALHVIRAARSALPNACAIAFFDTAFHASLPVHVSAYAIDQRIAHARRLRKWGFHGLSYAFITRTVAQYLGIDASALNIIALHLGSGASACAIRAGRSIDTSMGLTPLSGLPGATRTGDVDPSLIFHYTSGRVDGPRDGVGMHRSHNETTEGRETLGITEAEHILNTQAGWKALTGTTDFGEIVRKADFTPPSDTGGDSEPSRNPYMLAFRMLLDRIEHYVGAYHVALRGAVHALVFAGGIGEHSAELRRAVVEGVRCLGYVPLDEDANRALGARAGVVVDIGVGAAEGGVGGGEGRVGRVLVCRTDEQVEMARQCAALQESGGVGE